jgi:hypothetical protein
MGRPDDGNRLFEGSGDSFESGATGGVAGQVSDGGSAADIRPDESLVTMTEAQLVNVENASYAAGFQDGVKVGASKGYKKGYDDGWAEATTAGGRLYGQG